jgi:hypothetical protein
MSPTREETGMEELRRIVRVANMTNESAFDSFTAEQCIKLIRACWASKWDILPDDLTGVERGYAAVHGVLSEECTLRLEKALS